MRCVLVAALVVFAGMATACGKNPVSSTGTSTSGGSSAGSPPPSLPTAQASDLAFCVSETNRYRAMKGRPALAQSTNVEQFAAAASKNDGLANVPHQYYQTHATGFSAENEVLRWPYNLQPTVQGIVAAAIQAFYSEGPGGGHYENIVGSYTQIGCGIYIDTNGITIVEDFR